MDQRGKAHRRHHITPSTIVAVVMVAAAGAVSWFGIRENSDAHIPAVPIVISAAAPAPDAAPPTYPLLANEGGLPTRVIVPVAGIDTSISEVGTVDQEGQRRWQTAWRAAGHHMDSARPGQPGNMVLTGHVSVADRGNIAVFKSLDKVRTGDVIEVQSGERVYRNIVGRVMVVEASNVGLLRSDHSATVTLITCTNDLKRRLVVVGTLEEIA